MKLIDTNSIPTKEEPQAYQRERAPNRFLRGLFLLMTITKLVPFVVLSTLFLSGRMGIDQLQPAPFGSHVEDAPSPSGRHLNRENDPSTTGD